MHWLTRLHRRIGYQINVVRLSQRKGGQDGKCGQVEGFVVRRYRIWELQFTGGQGWYMYSVQVDKPEPEFLNF
jgi:hypothetical protein